MVELPPTVKSFLTVQNIFSLRVSLTNLNAFFVGVLTLPWRTGSRHYIKKILVVTNFYQRGEGATGIWGKNII